MDKSVQTIAEAKTKLGEPMKQAQSKDPEWRRKTKRMGNLAEFFAASLCGSGLVVQRSQETPHATEL